MARTYDVYCGKRVELPRITEFLMEYNALCKRHELCFSTDSSYGSAEVLIIPERSRPPEEEDVFADPPLSEDIPEFAEAIARAKSEYEDEKKAMERINLERAKEIATNDPIRGLEMAHQFIGQGNSSAWVPVAKAAIAEAITRLRSQNTKA